MSEEENKASTVKDIAETVSTIAKEIPIYNDAVQPAAKELGKGLTTIVKTVNVALAPLEIVVWGYSQIKDYVSSSVTEKLKNTPEEDIVTPKISVAGPALEALRFAGDEESLREMYTTLLANSMDKKTKNLAHPAFVEILKNMNSDEAKIMKFFASRFRQPIIDIESSKTELKGKAAHIQKFSLIGYQAECEFPDFTPNYIDNLCRLGLLNIRSDLHLTDESLYEPLINHPVTEEWKKKLKNESRKLEVTKGLIERTDMGFQFCKTCIIDKNNQA